MTELVEIEDRKAVRIIAINRPEVRNAINTGVLLGLRNAIKQAARDEKVRAIVITGRGGAFSGGADVKEWSDKKKGIDPHPDHDWVEEAIQLVQEIARLPKPTIAMIDGAAVGGGLDIALACDFRIASTKAKFICAYTRVGYPPDCGGSWLLPRLIGLEAAKLFVYTGDLWDAAKAKSVGMVTEIVSPEELDAATMTLAEKLASGPTVATGLAKQLLDAAYRRTFAEQLAEEERAGKVCAKTADHAEGLAAANEKRAPQFAGH
ncbi:enoyl-CoA hydratase/isomerase family protein [Dongia soli]|uniref:Enoyl-CoA hydratase-related protein n=1 Tax=Dongia soli TaxID=600628 RepID=A0ABU5EBV7_9PROT|nr:enoyl-CoA hydratase-related protein [Dongia soli]MDY0883769.1 enoyl-CoA hydratase-related protein [Dongia soli]